MTAARQARRPAPSRRRLARWRPGAALAAVAAVAAVAMLTGCAASAGSTRASAASGSRTGATASGATAGRGAGTGSGAGAWKAQPDTATARLASAGTVSAGMASAGGASAGGASAATAANCTASLSPQAGGPSVTSGSYAAQIRRRGYLIAGVDQTTYHFGYLNPLDGQIEGFDIDMVKDVAAAIFGLSPDSKALPAHIHFKAISDADRIGDVQHGQVDIVAHTMTVNCQRQAQVDFSTIYYDASAQVLEDKPANGGTPPDLAKLGAAKAKVCATDGSDDLTIISKAGARVPAPPVDFWSDCLVQLEEGKVAAVVTDNSILYGMQAQDPDTVVTGGSLEDEPYGLAISKAHPDFVRFVNAVLAADGVDQDTGRWAQSYRTWVSAAGKIPTWPIDFTG